MHLFAPNRLTPRTRTIVVEQRRASVPFEYRIGRPDDCIFTADVYAYRNHTHPDRHLGWWRFDLPAGRGEAALACDFGPIRRESMQLRFGGALHAPVDAWFNPDYAIDPLADFQLVLRNGANEIQRIEPLLMKFVDRDILRAFYVRQYATSGYAAGDHAPFLPELHRYKLGRLRRLFDTLIPSGGRVVDVGCGRSLFTEIDAAFPFHVFAGDLDFDSVHDRAVEVPGQSWAVFDAAALPFADAQFDALFAGEVIEHVPDVQATLREWWRVLKPGGVAIITTPNRERLLALVDGVERPYSPDHLSELSYRQLARQLLPASGFEFVAQDCLYLELLLKNVFNRHRVDDFLQTTGNRRDCIPTMKRLFPLGRFVPWMSMAMIVVARKVDRPAA
jgi:2-polyprenyl-3-methyl-5-hydroxy-6-metoxy-1,4-benzoquinol methylase